MVDFRPNPRERDGGASRLSVQLAALGLTDAPSSDASADGSGVSDTSMARERARWTSVSLRPLEPGARVLPMRARLKRSSGLRAALALAACAALVVAIRHQRANDDGLRYKGEANVTLFRDRAGVVSKLTPGDVAVNGDRFRAEIVSPTALVAFWGLETRNGMPVTAPDEGHGEAGLAVAAGARTAFGASFELAGANEGERVWVALCSPATMLSGAAKSRATLSEAGCEIRVYPLR